MSAFTVRLHACNALLAVRAIRVGFKRCVHVAAHTRSHAAAVHTGALFIKNSSSTCVRHAADIKKYFPEAAATSLLLAPSTDPNGGPTCAPGHGTPSTWNCAGYKPGFTVADCERVGCCVDPVRVRNLTDGWCYPKHTGPTPRGFVYDTHPWIVNE